MRRWAVWGLFLLASGCDDGPARGGAADARPAFDARAPDDASEREDAGEHDAETADGANPDAGDAGAADGGASDATPADAGSRADASALDAGAPDADPLDVGVLDAAPPDAGFPDATPADAGFPDAAPVDAGSSDASAPDAGSVACTNGAGRALWRITWPSNQGGYARVESWDAACAYSLADPACSLSGEPHDYANWGPGVVFDQSRDFFRVRFSVAGLSFVGAQLYVSAHADGGGIPNAVLESPIYGSLSFAPTVPISTHRTYVVDWSAFLSPSDPPSLTAVTLRSMPSGLAVSELELCVQ